MFICYCLFILHIVGQFKDMSFLENFMEFAHTDKYGVWQKIFFFTVFMIAVVTLDKYIGFSFFAYQSSKIELIEKINDIENSNASYDILSEVQQIKKEVLEHERNYWFFFRNLHIPSIEYNNNIPAINNVITKNRLLILSSIWVWVVVMIMILFTLPFDKKTSLWEKLSITFAVALFSFLLSLLYSYLLSFIPIFDNINWNYSLNFLLSGFVTWFIFYRTDKSNKKKVKNAKMNKIMNDLAEGLKNK